MPRKYTPVPKVKLSTAQLRKAAEAIAPLAFEVAQIVATRAAEFALSGEPAPRRAAHRGSQLSAAQQLGVMMFAVAVESNASMTSRVFGYNRKTVRRLLRTSRYRKFQAVVEEHVAGMWASSMSQRDFIRFMFPRSRGGRRGVRRR
jgi:hypothetical protein